MDPFALSWFRIRFQNMFLSANGDAFQSLFADVMSRRNPVGFIRTRPWGKIGDRKNDGYNAETRTLYQVYAPDELTANEAVNKITEDFNGAVPHWQEFFDTWVFVHNARKGLGPQVLTCLLELAKANKEFALQHFGYEALEKEVLALSQSDLEAILGHPPTVPVLNSIRTGDLLPVLDRIAGTDSLSVDIKPVSPEKIAKNDLSEDSLAYLQFGRRKSDLVETVFNSLPDPEQGEQIAQSFRDRYQELKSQPITPDEILSYLVEYATGGFDRSLAAPAAQRFQAAVASVIAYLFERCDIFEDPEDWK